MSEINFQKIVPRGGSVENAFEELCCQLASRMRSTDTVFERFRGDGGDGGVECKLRGSNGVVTGWQSKYVFDIDSLLTQASQSLQMALVVHPDLTKYVVCFPFDLTGKTKRKGKSQTEKFDAWAIKAVADAKAVGRELTIERWTAHTIQDLLLANDASGGLRHYFFSETTLTKEWFLKHISDAQTSAGPRYSRELSLDTPLSMWFSSFSGDSFWRTQLTELVDVCRKESEHLVRLIDSKGGSGMTPEWPAASRERGLQVVLECQKLVTDTAMLAQTPTELGFRKLNDSLTDLIGKLVELEGQLANMKSQIAAFANAGATTVMWFNLPDLSLTPYADSLSASAQTALHNASLQFSVDWAAAIADLEATHASLNIVAVDIYSLFNSVATDPSAYGLTNVTDSAQGKLVNPDQYLFWDSLHPTTAADSLIADLAYDQLLAVPEPGTVCMLSLGLIFFAFKKAKRK